MRDKYLDLARELNKNDGTGNGLWYQMQMMDLEQSPKN